jgi:hypothetical protein
MLPDSNAEEVVEEVEEEVFQGVVERLLLKLRNSLFKTLVCRRNNYRHSLVG